MDLWHSRPGTTPVLIDIPHCGTHVPPEIERDMTADGRRVLDTDWHVEKLYDFAPRLGAGLFHATHSRYVADLNRDPDGTPLYPGADNTEVCPLRTFHDKDIWQAGRAPDAAETARRVATYWRPYHAALAAEIAAVKARHGYCILLDGHSIFSEVPRFFAGRLPDLNLGTAGGASCAPALQGRAEAILAAAAPFSRAVNGRFKGGYITRHYGRPAEGIHTLQLEMAMRAYLDEAEPERFDRGAAAALIGVLERLVGELVAWSPAS
ncbi:MAG: N-formylglutamate deformylase [Rhodospirillaceae bacterium]|nr:N-formylglutamate deformylase [Rhodospirillaceae bacterium]